MTITRSTSTAVSRTSDRPSRGNFGLDEERVEQSVLYRDYHPKNLVLEPDATVPLVRAILDFNFRPVGDARFDVAVAEVNLVGLPIGGTERADSLRDALRGSYVDARGGTPADYFDERYPYYQLLAVADYLNYVDYTARLAREHDSERVVERLRAFVRARCAEIGSA